MPPLVLPASVRRWIVRFGYDGSEFSGWARQPGLQTVEGVIRSGLASRGIAPSPEEARLEVASRTDRGVSARGNVLALRTSIPGESLLRRLNTIAPEIYFTAAARVSSEFRVRRAIRRTYRYFEAGPTRDLGALSRAARLFQGRVDARSFGRGLPSRTPQWRTVESVSLRGLDRGQEVEVKAPSFVWGMVRKIIGALREVDAGRLSLSRLEAAIGGASRLTLPLAEPEGLVLWSVEYPKVRWESVWNGPNRHQARFAAEAREAHWRRASTLRALFDPWPP
jgi:tRNA pseudouridine38-40 synthase